MKQYILFNPKAGGGTNADRFKNEAALAFDGETEIKDMTTIGSYADFFAGIGAEDRVVVCGGDGTLNRFINGTDGIEIKNPIMYFACGTGNDFMNDIKAKDPGPLVSFNKYMEHLPKVTVKGKTYRFLNNVGYGIDGYCTEVGDAMREAGKAKINYTAIAIKGLLGGFKRVNATICIDGMTKSYKNVWLAPSMNGRFMGGGMMAAPSQDRLNPEHKVTVMVMYCPRKLKTLMVFPSIFKGEHIKHTEMVEEFKGKDITVKFDIPTALQVDGETIKGVTEYHVTAG